MRPLHLHDAFYSFRACKRSPFCLLPCLSSFHPFLPLAFPCVIDDDDQGCSLCFFSTYHSTVYFSIIEVLRTSVHRCVSSKRGRAREAITGCRGNACTGSCSAIGHQCQGWTTSSCLHTHLFALHLVFHVPSGLFIVRFSLQIPPGCFLCLKRLGNQEESDDE